MITLNKQHRHYEKYRESGVEWLGNIPDNWETKKLKYSAKINPEKLEDATDPSYQLTYVDIGNVDSNGNIVNTDEYAFTDAPSRARRKVKNKDTIISTVRTYLKAIGYVDHPPDNMIVSTGFSVLRPVKQFDSKYFWRMISSYHFVSAVVAHSDGVSYPAINPTRLATLPVWIPSSQEQSSIASYLDEKCELIDSIIAKKKRQIELLKEKRATIINMAVTKGVDPIVHLQNIFLACEQHVQTGERNLISKLCQQIEEMEKGYDCDVELEKETRERPDIVVHRRGNNNDNHLAIEVKIAASQTKAQSDIDKLKRLMLGDYQYRYALFIDYGDTDLAELDFGRVGCIQIRKGIINFYRAPKPEMKESGVEWLGEIPRGWQRRSLRYCTAYTYAPIKTGPFGSDLKGDDFRYDGEFRVYNQRNVLDDNFDEPALYISNDKFNDLKSCELFPSDVLITSRGTIGKTAIFPQHAVRGILHPCLIRITINDKVCLPDYLRLILQKADYIKEQFILISNGTTIEVIYSNTLKATALLLPPISEQIEILQYIHDKTAETDQFIQILNHSLSLLSEYKTSLIAHAVTGRVKVTKTDHA